MRALRPFLARLRGDTRGLALIEFAFCVPILLLLFVGGYQISDAVFASRKVSATARTVADLASQYTQVTNADLDMILNASQQVLTPYKIESAELRVSQLTIGNKGKVTVDWSRAKNDTKLKKNAVDDAIPAEYRVNGTTIILAEVTYRYVPYFASEMIGNIDLQDQMVMYPRKSTKVKKS